MTDPVTPSTTAAPAPAPTPAPTPAPVPAAPPAPSNAELTARVSALEYDVACMRRALLSLGSLTMGGAPGIAGYQAWHRGELAPPKDLTTEGEEVAEPDPAAG